MTNTTVTSVDLVNNNISEEGAQALATALMTNTTVTSVDLGINIIDAEGAQALATALMTNTTVTHVDLVNNSIGAEGAQALVTALSTNMTLRKLTMSYPDPMNVTNFLARNVALWEQHLWQPVRHITFPQACHPLVVTTLLCGKACPAACMLPMRVWCFIFTFLRRENFFEGGGRLSS